MHERVFQGYEKALGAEHLSTLATVSNLGVLYQTQGRLSKAEAMYERALQGYKKALGSQWTDEYLKTMQHLASLHHQLDRVAEAKALYVSCQAGLKEMFGVQHHRYTRVTEVLASLP
jgi:hypothetical protein